ncbi:MAG: immunoglobulin domain-containing protein, partial [Verrucomicrobia bacterium]|nr:immunoglobulin domain-containing protein [Verrucomicrobiota bacterium]
DVADLANPLQIAAFSFPLPATANGNGVGAVDFGPGWLVALETQNGVLGIKIEELTTPVPPSIGTQPIAQDVLEGAGVGFSVGATGSKPLEYQWFRNDEPIAEATNATYHIAGVTPADAGTYKVTVSNAVDVVTSDAVTLGVRALVKSGRLVRLWSKGIGDYAWLANDNAHRGMAFNPVSGNVLVVSRTLGATNVYVLDGETGAEKHRLRSTDASDANFIFGGLFPLNMIAVADDGAVYACCLTLSGTDTTIYRWADDQPDTIPALAFGPGDSGLVRTGDTIQARGSGAETQLILASRNGKTVAVFTTTDGATFNPTVVTTAEAADGNFGLGVAFGGDDTFWGNATGTNNPLTQVAFNLSAGTGNVRQRYAEDLFPSYISAIGVLPGKSLLAGLALDTPDNVHLYDLSDPDVPVLVHQELLPSDNPNPNGTGAIDFGDNRLYVLDSNNGIVAFELREGAPVADPAVLGLPAVADGALTFSLSGTVGAVYTLRRSADLADWTDVGSYPIPAGGTTNVVELLTGQAGFYRAVAP